jgi:ElaB/YqjD/DUF883 family membrane-anchored ribosome-binding protein
VQGAGQAKARQQNDYSLLSWLTVEMAAQLHDIWAVIRQDIRRRQLMKANRIDPKDIDLDYLRNEFQRFRADIAGVKDKLSGNATDALDQISSYLNGGALASRISTLEAELESLAGKAKGYGKEGVAQLEQKVSERPIVSVAVAFGVGLLAAQLFRR